MAELEESRESVSATPRIATPYVVLPEACGTSVKFGVLSATFSIVEMREAVRSAPEKEDTAIGTSCRFSSRRCAVTTISSMRAPAASCAHAAVVKPPQPTAAATSQSSSVMAFLVIFGSATFAQVLAFTGGSSGLIGWATGFQVTPLGMLSMATRKLDDTVFIRAGELMLPNVAQFTSGVAKTLALMTVPYSGVVALKGALSRARRQPSRSLHEAR